MPQTQAQAKLADWFSVEVTWEEGIGVGVFFPLVQQNLSFETLD